MRPGTGLKLPPHPRDYRPLYNRPARVSIKRTHCGRKGVPANLSAASSLSLHDKCTLVQINPLHFVPCSLLHLPLAFRLYVEVAVASGAGAVPSP